ncbi:MAG: peptidoglycan DD-metalloendopeptidase family protein [Nitrospinae bacterium]|nr:peptidoglycan DD-metalloendopeptidase family protein [Nitrospinota bacterium]MBL7020687.1 peptidoglycan DD-metalloendopeptidase family protein [Nitrospinaceae bacterium]
MADPHQKGLYNSNKPKRLRWRRLTWFAGVALISFFLVGATHHFHNVPAQTAHKAQSEKLEFPPLELKSLEEPESETEPQPEIEKEVYRWIKGDVARNQSLSHLMSDHGIPLKTVLELVKQSRPTYNLSRLRAGQPYSIKLTSDDRLAVFTYQADENRELFIERKGDEFVSRLIAPDYEIRLGILEGVIQENLITTVLEAGGSYKVATDLEEIFAWQINFFKDLRVGDSFKVLVEKRFLDQAFSGFGKIRAVTFQNRGKNLSAVYFKPEGGHGAYYASDGRPLKKQFLKSPLKYTRITSRFTHKRFHPIYKKHMAHRAVDYAAPRGTPIYAISDGEVLRVSRNARSGKHLKLKHPNGYESSYSHLSRYAANLSRGKKVQQGQVIGYVGATGAATGAHLCFHLRKNGRSINPLTFQSPGGPDLEEKSQKAFRLLAQQEMQALNHPEILKTQFS